MSIILLNNANADFGGDWTPSLRTDFESIYHIFTFDIDGIVFTDLVSISDSAYTVSTIFDTPYSLQEIIHTDFIGNNDLSEEVKNDFLSKNAICVSTDLISIQSGWVSTDLICPYDSTITVLTDLGSSWIGLDEILHTDLSIPYAILQSRTGGLVLTVQCKDWKEEYVWSEHVD